MSARCLGKVNEDGPAVEGPAIGGSSAGTWSGCSGSEYLQKPVPLVFLGMRSSKQVQ